ncbi:MAG: hypothetical protein G01um101470_274 [Parcubacteria group bacterium Gr01-1014_70]|nr:MAG: hypothetical protein G01um101470_274 [Parcubacteria group bacterium Gr01-1014_70]
MNEEMFFASQKHFFPKFYTLIFTFYINFV